MRWQYLGNLLRPARWGSYIGNSRNAIAMLKKRINVKDRLEVILKQCGINPAELYIRVANRNSLRTLCCQTIERFETSRTEDQEFRQQHRHDRLVWRPLPPGFGTQCPTCKRQCASQFGLCSHQHYVIDQWFLQFSFISFGGADDVVVIDRHYNESTDW